MIWTGFSALFSQKHKAHRAYSSSTPSIHPSPPTTTHPLTALVLHSCFSLFRNIFIVQEGLAMACHLWIYCTLISLAPSITLPYHFPPPLIIQQLSVHLFPTEMQGISILFTIILFSSPALPSPFKQPPIPILQTYYIYVYIYIHI
jgi:hypothetical protein